MKWCRRWHPHRFSPMLACLRRWSQEETPGCHSWPHDWAWWMGLGRSQGFPILHWNVRAEGLHVTLGYPLIPFLGSTEGHHMVLPCPDISTAHAGESESFLSSSPSLYVLKKWLLSFFFACWRSLCGLKNYGSFIGNSVLHAKRAYYCRHLHFFSPPVYPNKGSK